MVSALSCLMQQLPGCWCCVFAGAYQPYETLPATQYVELGLQVLSSCRLSFCSADHTASMAQQAQDVDESFKLAVETLLL
jgi:hypothetical protein